MTKKADFLKTGLAGLLLLFFLGFGIESSVVAPEYAMVLVDPLNRVYLAPQCLSETQNRLARTTIREARKAGLQPDPACRDTGAFRQDTRSLSGMLLENIGILDPLKPRWNKDGSWNVKPGVTSLAFNETPEPMRKNVYALAEAGAVLQICFESPAYKTLSNKKALELHGLLIRVGDLVRAIGKHYNDDVLYTTHEMSKAEMSSDPELKEYVKDKYHFCDEPLLTDMHSYLTENENIITDFLKNDAKKSGSK
ncbi:MAG: hypothetical protein UZ03_NOB001001674 [Nitrospira sp. OLB3]|nr:MAG: hypothetical protein UZ03_NOB001001674 [Nitrospira sp. OLB3]